MSGLVKRVESHDLQIMNFHGDEIITFRVDGEPYVAMRRIVENLGMNWGTQRDKLIERANFVCTLMGTHDNTGRIQKMLCMPAAKLPLWLATINPNKIKNSKKREKIERYQEESAVALHNYWTKGVAIKGDLDGTVTDLSQEVKKAIGGIVKGIIHKELGSVLPALIQSELAAGHMAVVTGLCASQVLDMAGFPKEERAGTRGVAQLVSNRLRRYHVEQGVPMKMGSLGDTTRYMFDVAVTKQWLLDGGKEQIARWVSEKKSGQKDLLKGVNVTPLFKKRLPLR